ncbi:MAG: hypothetical protein HC851_12050 [Acaryochloris sp. RU_4_1]|nr:hypothetical protein [Acaryochloris sp. RU_4_1]NJR54967.1 hypothetical protein [Acaryochloris sp. CRU_2_0]
MMFTQPIRRLAMPLLLALVLLITPACSTSAPTVQAPQLSSRYTQIEQGNTPAGQDFGAWITQTSKGLITDAYVRDNNKLGVVISKDVRPNEVRNLTKSLVQGFHKNFPKQDLTVLMYAPDKKLILTAQYDNKNQQIQYQS